MGIAYSQEELSFLLENYSNYGAQYCASKTGRSLNSILIKANRMGLKLSDKCYKRIKNAAAKNRKKRDFKYKVPAKNFISNITPESAYILGLLWADGCVRITKANTASIKIESISKDMKEYCPIFKKTGSWGRYTRQRQGWQETTSLFTSNRPLANYLIQNGYKANNKDASLILRLIPNELLHYWFLGLTDGDGSWYANPKTHQKQFSISSHINQNWCYLTNQLELLNIIDYKSYASKNTKGAGSAVELKTYHDLIIWGNFVYKDYNINKIGLNRKYKIFEIIKDMYYVALKKKQYNGYMKKI